MCPVPDPGPVLGLDVEPDGPVHVEAVQVLQGAAVEQVGHNPHLPTLNTGQISIYFFIFLVLRDGLTFIWIIQAFSKKYLNTEAEILNKGQEGLNNLFYHLTTPD